ncbi:hypothetical protein D3C81_2306610 [compost metagenome]
MHGFKQFKFSRHIDQEACLEVAFFIFILRHAVIDDAGTYAHFTLAYAVLALCLQL